MKKWIPSLIVAMLVTDLFFHVGSWLDRSEHIYVIVQLCDGYSIIAAGKPEDVITDNTTRRPNAFQELGRFSP